MKMKITLTNDFHNTECVVIAQGNTLTRSQARRAWKTLCGIKGCVCGGEFGERKAYINSPDGLLRVSIVPESADTFRIEQ